MHQYKTEQFLPIGRKKAWEFFSSPNNLRTITPPELDLLILTKLNGGGIYEGMEIEYTVRPVLGIRVKWKTEICKVKDQEYFMDKQVRGPYKVWEHTHSFIETSAGVMMIDIVNYELPLGVLGKLAEKLYVNKKIESIFDYRKEVLEKLFLKFN